MKHSVSTSRTPVWDILIPVKGLAAAKSRLSGSIGAEATGNLTGITNADLALAFVLDVVTAAVPCLEVDLPYVVTRDNRVGNLVSETGAEVIVEPESWDSYPALVDLSPLNAAVQYAANQIRVVQDRNFSYASPRPPIAIITGDLPCLDKDSLAEVLTLAWTHDRSFVPDHTGLGTAMLCIKDPSTTGIDPRFGADSARAHEASGAVRLETAPLRARLDVDTAADLGLAQELGVGIETAKVLESLNPSTFAK